MMRIKDLEHVVGLKPVYPDYKDAELLHAYTSDLLSDVMSNAKEESVLITIQAHKNTVAVAQLIGIKAVVLCNDRDIPDDMMTAAKDNGIALFVSGDNQFTVSYMVARKLLGN